MFWNKKEPASADADLPKANRPDPRFEKYSRQMEFFEASTLIKFIRDNTDVLRKVNLKTISTPQKLDWGVYSPNEKTFFTKEPLYFEFETFILGIHYPFTSELTAKVFPNNGFSEGCEIHDIGSPEALAPSEHLALPEKELKEILVQRFSHEVREGSADNRRLAGGDYFSIIILMFEETGLWVCPEGGVLNYKMISRQKLEGIMEDSEGTFERILVAEGESYGSEPFCSLEDVVAEKGSEEEERVEFDFSQWSKQYLESAEELQRRLDTMELIGRKISDIRFVSHVYNMTDVNFDSIIYHYTQIYPKEIERYMDYKHIPDAFPIPLDFEMDEPVLIKFEDGDVLEILTQVEGTFNICMNEIPWNSASWINYENINGSRLCEFCKGAVITKAEVITDKDMFGVEDIPAVRIEWEKDGRQAFVFRSYAHDYMTFEVTDSSGDILKYPYIKFVESMYKQ